MVYMGSKRKFTGDIAPIINKYIKDNNITEFYDVFCGGANLTDKIICDNVYGIDLSPTLIALHQQAQKDFSVIPEEGSREWYDEAYAEYKKILKNFSDKKTLTDYEAESSMPLWKIGAIEWYGTFSSRGFSGGYAKPTETRRDYITRRKNHLLQSETDNYKRIYFSQNNYLLIDIPKNALIYCDPPYKATKPYQINPHFNHAKYYDWLREKSKTNPIFMSEQEMPNDFPIIWTKDTNRTNGLDNTFKATEKLYFIDNRN